MPSTHRIIKKVLEQVPRDFKGKIVDLGSGFGHLARALAKHCPNAQIEGYEISPLPWFLSCLYPHPSRLTFKRKNFLKIELSDAHLLVCYLCPHGMEQLQEKFQELQPGTLVISIAFALPSRTPSWTYRAIDFYHTHVYGYEY